MAEASTNIIISAKDEASGALAKISGGFDGLSGKVGAFVAAAGVAAAAVAGARWLTDLTGKALDAAGRLDDLAQATGVSGETLSRFSIAAKLGGTDIEGLAGGLQKLNIKIDDAANGGSQAAAAFGRIGVSVKDAGGEVRSTEDILGDVAERFATMEDGAAKTSIAVDLFGKSGTNLIPMLNSGRDGLDEAARAADALGITLSGDTIAAAAAAGDSLDLMGQISVGLGNKIMAEVAPTITGLTERFTAFVIESGAVDVAAKVIAGAFNVIVNAGQIVTAVFQLVANNVSTVAKAVTLAAQGEFSAAFDTVKSGFSNAGKIITTTGSDIAKVWTGELSKVEPKAVTTAKSITAIGSAAKGAKAETDKAAEGLKKFVDALDEKIRTGAEELAATEKLTDADKLRSKFLADLEAGTIKATAAERASTLAKLDQFAAQIKAKEAAEAEKKARDDLQKALVERINTEVKAADALLDAIAKQKEQNEEIGKTKQELGLLEIKRLADARATTEQRLRVAELTSTSASEVEAIRDQVAGYTELIALKEEGLAAAAMAEAAEAAKDAAKESAAEWQKTSDSIQQSLTDALMRGFEGGKGFLENLVSTAKNLFQTLILRPTIQAALSPISAGIGAAFGLPGAANAATGAGGLGNVLSSVMGSFGGGLSSLGTNFAISGVGEALGLSNAVLGGAGVELTSLGSAISGIGTVLPWIGGAIALYSLFSGKGGGPKSGGSFSTTGERLFTPNGSDASLASLGLDQQIAALTGAFGGSFAGGLGLGFDTDPQGDASSRVASFVRGANGELLLDNIAGRDIGRDEDALQAELQTEAQRVLIAALQGSNLPQAYAEYFAQFDPAVLTAGQAEAAIAAATNARSMTTAVQDLGGVFATFGQLSVDARDGILGLTGGLDAFLGKVQGYVSNFYSSEEQAGITAQGIVTALEAVGLSTDLGTKEDFRSLVDSLDVSTTMGQQQLATLLNVQGQFASIADFLTTNSTTLSGAAALSPGGPAFAEMARQADGTEAIVEQNAAYYTESLDVQQQTLQMIREIYDLFRSGASAPAATTA